jgi:hypothetical protein
MRESRIPGFIGCTNSIEVLCIYLVEFRRIIEPEAIIHIQLPSAHTYVIEQEITVIKELPSIKIMGQVHLFGKPYVHAAIEGFEEADGSDVGCLLKPNVVGAWDKVGAAAGDLGAGIAGGAVGFFNIGLAAAMNTPAAPVVVGCVALAGLLGGSSAAGALTGIDITQRAKWRGIWRDKKSK